MLIVMEHIHTLMKHLNALTVRAAAGKCLGMSCFIEVTFT